MKISKYQKLSDLNLFKFIQYLYNQRDDDINIDSSSYDDDDISDFVKNNLKKFGLDLNVVDIDFFWVTFQLNFNNLLSHNKLDFKLERAKPKEYEIILKFHGRTWYEEWGKQTTIAYSEDGAKGFANSDDFNPWDSDFYDYETTESENDDWNIDEINEIGKVEEKNISEEKKIIKSLVKENFENVVSDYSIDELILLRDFIEEKLKNKIKLI